MKKLLITLFAATSLLAACDKNNDYHHENVFKGAPLQFQHGKAWTSIELDDDGKPLKASIVIDNEAMESLDTNTTSGGHHHTNSVSLKFHSKASALPFNHALLDWVPGGHEPFEIYGKPHFDFHFYIQPEAERAAIPPFETDSSKFKILPSPAFFPPTYFPAPGGVLQMGVHWLDATTPELNGQPFTQTFIYGSYDGKLTFFEPMITKTFIDANPTFSRDFPVAGKLQVAGYYPTKYNLKRNEDGLVVSLENFVYRQAN